MSLDELFDKCCVANAELENANDALACAQQQLEAAQLRATEAWSAYNVEQSKRQEAAKVSL